MNEDYNSKSYDSLISVIFARLDTQDALKEVMHRENQRVLKEILCEQKVTNGRVTKLENWKVYLVGISVGISIASAALWRWIGLIWPTK